MTNISLLTEYISIVIIGLCLCIGYIIKHSLNFIPNKYIPLILGISGLICSIGATKDISLEIILTGLLSGLSSTGCYEAFCNLVEKKDEE